MDDHTRFGHLRSLLQGPLDDITWYALCAHLDQWSDLASLEAQALPYVSQALERGAKGLRRVVPSRWWSWRPGPSRATLWRPHPGWRLAEHGSLGGRGLDSRALQDLLDDAGMAQLRSLQVWPDHDHDRCVALLAEHPGAASLERLMCLGAGLGDCVGRRGLKALGRARGLSALRSLALLGHSGLPERSISQLAQRQLGAPLRALYLDTLQGPQLGQLLSSPLLSQVQTLGVRCPNLDPTHVAQIEAGLARRQPDSPLRALRLGGMFSEQGALSLASSPGLLALDALSLSRTGFHAQALAQAMGAGAAWRWLDLSYNPLYGDADHPRQALTSFAQHAMRVGPHTLILSACGLSSPDLRALLTTGAWSQLRCLDLSSNRLDDEALIALAGHEPLRQLTTLVLSRNAITSRGVEALADSPWLAHLSWLDLSSNAIDARGVRALARSRARRSLRYLNLSSNPLRDDGALAILDAADALTPQVLALSYTHMQDAGAQALLDDARMGAVASLSLDHNDLLSCAQAALRRSPADLTRHDAHPAATWRELPEPPFHP